MKKALHAKPFRLQMPGHTPRHARPEPARSKLLRGVSLCLAAVCLADSHGVPGLGGYQQYQHGQLAEQAG